MKHSIIRNCLLVLIAFVSVGGCEGAVIIVSNPAPPLDSDFNGGTVIVVAEGASNIAGITSNGDEVIIVMEDTDGSLLGLVGLAISGTECEIVMFTKEPIAGFYQANGKCSLEEAGSVFKLEEVSYAGTTLDFTGKLKDAISSESENKNADSSSHDPSEDMLDFQEDILESLN
ncbi:MAG: hypothetical protein WBD99_14855 [Thermodesulfobacteriota bacterium]